MAPDPEQCEVRIRLRGSHTSDVEVTIQKEEVPEGVWQRSGVLCELVEQCRDSGKPMDIAIPLVTANISLWLEYSEAKRYDVAARCKLLDVRSSLSSSLSQLQMPL